MADRVALDESHGGDLCKVIGDSLAEFGHWPSAVSLKSPVFGLAIENASMMRPQRAADMEPCGSALVVGTGGDHIAITPRVCLIPPAQREAAAHVDGPCNRRARIAAK